MKSTKIVAAAIKHNGKIYEGKRHAEIMRRIWEESETAKILQEDQGFLSNTGEFLNRSQAGEVAFVAGQTKTKHNTLFSEDLW